MQGTLTPPEVQKGKNEAIRTRISTEGAGRTVLGNRREILQNRESTDKGELANWRTGARNT